MVPKLTALVSLYNSGQFLENRINNLANTTAYKQGDLLIYLINASSPDPDDDRIANKFAGMVNYTYEVIPHCTVYAAWNHAISKVKTPFITNANADDIIHPDAYTTMMKMCNQHHSVLAYCDWYMLDRTQPWPDQGFNLPTHRAGQYNPQAGNMSCGHFPLWKRSIHDQIGLFDPWFKALGDADLWYRCWISSIKNFIYVSNTLGGYQWRGGDNLWHRTHEAIRHEEWKRIYGRQPGKLEI